MKHDDKHLHGDNPLLDGLVETITNSTEGLRAGLHLCPSCFYGSLVLSLYATACFNDAFDDETKKAIERQISKLNGPERKLH